MARIRTIKPEFFLHEGLADLSPLHRLFFIGLWTLADKEGRLEDRPRRIKAALLPWEDCDVDGLLDGLLAAGFVRRYEVNGVACIAIPSFRRHQRPHPKETASVLPAPPSREVSRQAVERLSDIPSSPAGKEILDNGKEISENGLTTLSATPTELALIAPTPAGKNDTPAKRVFEHWRERTGRTSRTAFDGKRRRAVEARLADGYTPDDLCLAVDGCLVTPHNQGQNERGEKYDDLELICRDAAHVDRFIRNAKNPPRPSAPDVRLGHVSASSVDWTNAKTGSFDEL